jgi:hypothetical protein
MLNHLARGVRPDLTHAPFRRFDHEIALCFLDIVYPANGRDTSFFDTAEGSRCLSILQAPCRMGGFGILSVMDTAAEAYVASVALVSAVVKSRQLLGPNFDPDVDGPRALPFFQAAVDSVRPLITPLDTDQPFDLTQQAQATLAQAIAEAQTAQAAAAAAHVDPDAPQQVEVAAPAHALPPYGFQALGLMAAGAAFLAPGATLMLTAAAAAAAVALGAAQHFVPPDGAAVEGVVVAQPGPVAPVFPVIVQPPPAVVPPAEPPPAPNLEVVADAGTVDGAPRPPDALAYTFLTSTNVWSASLSSVQAALGKARKLKKYSGLALAQPTVEARALLLSKSSGQSAAWIFGFSQHLSNAEFDDAVRTHMSLPSIPQAAGHGLHCNLCFRRVHGQPLPNIVDHTGSHAICCRSISRNFTPSLHEFLAKIVRDELRTVLRGVGALQVLPKEPVMADYFSSAPGVHADHRADVGVIYAQSNKPAILLDIKTVNPMARTFLPLAATRPGHAASKKYDDTLKTYHARFPTCKGILVPFVIERGGRIHATSWARLKNIIKPAFTTYVPDGKGGRRPVVDFANFNRALQRRLVERMQTAVQRSSWALTKLKANVPKMVATPTDYLNAEVDGDGDDDALDGDQAVNA